MKRCEGCGELYGPNTAARLADRRFCSDTCFNKTQQPRHSRTMMVERLGETGITQAAIAERVGLCQSQVQRLLARKRKEDLTAAQAAQRIPESR